MPIEAIFFDIGDTLVSDLPALDDRIWTACDACGLEIDRNRLMPGLRRVEDFVLEGYADGATTDDPEVMLRTARRLLAELGVESSEDSASALVAAFVSTPFERVLHPKALSLIDVLRARGFKIGVISDWDPALPDLLAEWDLASRLDAVAVSGIVGCTKPNPALFRHALDAAGVDAAASLHVGDFYELDVAGARAAGMQAILFDAFGRRPEADCPRVATFDELVDTLLVLPSPNS